MLMKEKKSTLHLIIKYMKYVTDHMLTVKINKIVVQN